MKGRLMATGVLALFFILGCGGDDSGGISPGVADVVEQDLDVSPGGILALDTGVTSKESCPGYKKNPNFPSSYQEFCECFIGQAEFDSGDKCFIIPQDYDTTLKDCFPYTPADKACFCQICAIQGVEENCVYEYCP